MDGRLLKGAGVGIMAGVLLSTLLTTLGATLPWKIGIAVVLMVVGGVFLVVAYKRERRP